MARVKAQVLTINGSCISVSPLQGAMKGKAFGLSFREGLEEGQFVDIDVHISGQRAEWPPVG